MKIVFVTAGMGGGGSERVIANICNFLVENEHEVLILMTAEQKVSYQLDSRIRIQSLGERTGGSIIKRLERIVAIRRIIASDAKQVIVSFGTETNMFTILAKLFLKNRLIISERNDPNQCHYKVLRNIIYSLADDFVFQTKDARNCFSEKIKKRSIIISNPIKTNLPEPFNGKRKKRIVAVGRLNYQKNHKLLLEAFADFSKEFPDFELMIYGQGELLVELKQYSETLQISKQVIFAGFSQTLLQEIIDAAMFVLSSDFEGISNSLMEAMAIGLPVISTDCPIGGSAELIESRENGILVPVKKREELGNAMKMIARDAEFAKKLSQNAILVRERYSNHQICGKWMEYICRQ